MAGPRLHPALRRYLPVAGTGAGGRPDFRDLVVYQFHVGTWYGPHRDRRVGTFLDVLDRIEYLADLGVNAIEPLPVVEYSTPRSMGYNGTDLFSPEMDYEVADDELSPYLALANRLLSRKVKIPAHPRGCWPSASTS